MAVTIFEDLQNANFNIKSGIPFVIMIAKEQLNNAVTLLEKGYSLDDVVEDLIEQYDSVDEVPNKKFS